MSSSAETPARKKDAVASVKASPRYPGMAMLDNIDIQKAAHDLGEPRESCPVDANEATPTRHWLTLLAYCLNSMLNSFCSVNFSVVALVTSETLHIAPDDTEAVGWFYTGFLLMVCVGMVPAMLMVVHCEGMALGFSVVMNVGCTWVRWLGVSRRDYTLCLASVLISAAGAWAIPTLPAQLSQRFPPHMSTFTTSLGVQANYLGWLLGSVIPPVVVADPDSMTKMMAWQAIGSLSVIGAFVVFYSPREQHERNWSFRSRKSWAIGQAWARWRRLARGSESSDLCVTMLSAQGESVASCDTRVHNHVAHIHVGGGDGGVYQLLRCFWRYPCFAAQVLACGILGGVSFALPGCDDELLGLHGINSQVVSMINAAFLATGVVSGLLLGKTVTHARIYGKVLKSLFVACTCALSIVAVLFETGIMQEVLTAGHIILTGILFSVAGMASLGFIGVGIQAAALYPCGSSYVCFSIEALVQVFGALLNQISLSGQGFTIMAGASWLATLLVFIGFHRYLEDCTNSCVVGEQHLSHLHEIAYRGGA